VKSAYGGPVLRRKMEGDQRAQSGGQGLLLRLQGPQARVKYDAVESDCMIDQLVSPEEARQGKAVDNYASFFARCTSGPRPALVGLRT